MKTAAFVAVTSAAVASAQLVYNNQTNTFSCPKPGQAYCAGSSLGTDIIVRCDATGRGQPGRCTDNLAGQPPLGVQPALCFQTSETSGDAACEKNCVIYGGSGNFPGTSTLPASQCTPYYTASSSTTAPTTTPSGTGGSGSGTTYTTLTTITSGTVTTVCPTTVTSQTTPPPPPPTGTGSGSTVNPGGNSTFVPPTGGPTKTPVGPTTTSSQTSPSGVVTAGAATKRVGGALAALGLAAAYLL